ncbi:MAG: gamma-glutamyl-gamma-aminobutyrate hydrolase family protein [Roseomonas sp.]|jgi:putative glutamine amidotransferase|nr:gamma-glutamyl-gamma-aminobutyrate hydrolase family protein [Roseomonas sp.]
MGRTTRVVVVGVTANHLVEDDVHRNWVRYRYIEALQTHAGVEVVLLATRSRGHDGQLDCLRRLDGLVLTGDESNLDPHAFHGKTGASPDYQRDILDRFRDRLSAAALRTALALGMPILGICRGLQEMNVLLGGTLFADLGATPSTLRHHEDTTLPRDRQYDPVHRVTLKPGGLLARMTGAQTIVVNSLHRQGIDRLGEGLEVEAVAPDGLVEAVTVARAPALQLGLQWHPEWHANSDRASQAIFAAFGDSCAAYSGRAAA